MLGGLTLAMVSGTSLAVKAETLDYISDPTSVVNNSGAGLYILPMGDGVASNRIVGGQYSIRQTEAITEAGEFVPVIGPTQAVTIDGMHPETGEFEEFPSIVNFSGEGVYEYYNSERVPGYYLDTRVYTVEVPSSGTFDFTGTLAETYATQNGSTLEEHIPGMSTADPKSVFTFPKLNLVKGDIRFTKTDAEGNPLAGAQFLLEQVTDARISHDGELIVREVVTDIDGIVEFTELPEGTYRVTELTAPEEYAHAITPQLFSVTVDETGLTQVTEEITDVADDLINEEQQFVNYKTPEIDVTISTNYGDRPIYSADDNIGVIYQIQLPENIEDYEYFNIKAQMPEEFVLGDLSETFFIGNRWGELVEHELIVEGQDIQVLLNSQHLDLLEGEEAITVYFPVELDKSALYHETVSDVTYRVEWDNGQGAILNEDRMESVTFKQGILEVLTKDGDTESAVEGAKFELYKYDEDHTLNSEFLPPLTEGEYIFEDDKYYTKVNNPITGEPYVATSGVDGTFMFENIPFGDYKLVQIEAAEGYRQNKTTVDVTIDDTEESRYDEEGNELYDIVTVEVSNFKGKEYFPGTGTTGNLMVIASAITMMLGAVGIGFKKKRNEA